MQLRIRDAPSDGYPTDYLIARIKGRGTALISDWRPHIENRLALPATDEEIWGALLRELAWLHEQMNRQLRETFAPLFALFEIKTVILCLRNRAIRRMDVVERLLKRSLLADEIKTTLLRGPEPGGNLQSLENELMRTFLEGISARDGALETFFKHFIDLRNVMLLYKHRRWHLGTRPRFISGGTMDVTLLESIRDDAALDELLRSIAGVTVAASEGALETILLRAMTRRLVKSRRTAGDTMLIIVYVWRLYTQARNLAVLYHGTALESRTLERELIL
jgi:hypothetical protein